MGHRDPVGLFLPVTPPALVPHTFILYLIDELKCPEGGERTGERRSTLANRRAPPHHQFQGQAARIREAKSLVCLVRRASGSSDLLAQGTVGPALASGCR